MNCFPCDNTRTEDTKLSVLSEEVSVPQDSQLVGKNPSKHPFQIRLV